MLHPLNLVVAGLQFQQAADTLTEHALHGTLDEVAERLLSTGLGRLADQ